MLDALNEIIIVLAALGLATISAVGLIWFGYWMGRNSRELPVRSVQNPRYHSTLKFKGRPPIPEPDEDLFNDAAYGAPEKDGIPTIGRT